MKATRSTLTFALLLVASPVVAAVNTTHNPAREAKPASIEAPDKLSVENRQSELPLECRGYYIRTHTRPDLRLCN